MLTRYSMLPFVLKKVGESISVFEQLSSNTERDANQIKSCVPV